jgi:hypothetical protein
MATMLIAKKIKKLTVAPQLSFSRTGYCVNADKTYPNTFLYHSLALMIGYAPVSSIAIRAGGYGAVLLDTNIKQGGRTYNFTDAGVLASIGFFEHKKMGVYLEGRRGFKPMLDYFVFDESGNFQGRLHDFYNLSLVLGIKFNIGRQPIRFYEE